MLSCSKRHMPNKSRGVISLNDFSRAGIRENRSINNLKIIYGAVLFHKIENFIQKCLSASL